MDYDVVLVGTDSVRHHLSDLAEVTDLTYSTAWGTLEGGGCGYARAAWKANLPSAGQPAWLAKGSRVSILAGPVEVWGGFLSEIDPGSPWTFAAQGHASQAADVMAFDEDGLPTSSARVAIPAAVGRGLPWSATLPLEGQLPAPFLIGGAAGDYEPGIHRLSGLLGAVAELLGKRWAVWSDGLFRIVADPTEPAFLARGLGPIAATADDTYVTHLHIRYAVTLAGMPPEPTQIGWVAVGDNDLPTSERVWEFYDLVPTLVTHTAGSAAAIGENRLALLAPRSGWTQTIQLGVDNLSTIGGVPSHPAFLEAGHILRVQDVYTPDQARDFLGHADILIAQTEYNATDETVRVTPFGLSPRSVRDVLTAVVDPKRAAYIAEWEKNKSWLEEYVERMREIGVEKQIPGVSAPWPWEE